MKTQSKVWITRLWDCKLVVNVTRPHLVDSLHYNIEHMSYPNILVLPMSRYPQRVLLDLIV